MYQLSIWICLTAGGLCLILSLILAQSVVFEPHVWLILTAMKLSFPNKALGNNRYRFHTPLSPETIQAQSTDSMESYKDEKQVGPWLQQERNQRAAPQSASAQLCAAECLMMKQKCIDCHAEGGPPIIGNDRLIWVWAG